MQTFIYAPLSGDRVFVGNPTSEIGVVTYTNLCRHIVGRYIELTFNAAVPGRWWRPAAKAAMTSIISALGGVAWDDCGIIHACVPFKYAFRINAMMRRVEKAHAPATEWYDPEDDTNIMSMLGCGAVRIRLPFSSSDVPAWKTSDGIIYEANYFEEEVVAFSVPSHGEMTIESVSWTTIVDLNPPTTDQMMRLVMIAADKYVVPYDQNNPFADIQTKEYDNCTFVFIPVSRYDLIQHNDSLPPGNESFVIEVPDDHFPALNVERDGKWHLVDTIHQVGCTSGVGWYRSNFVDDDEQLLGQEALAKLKCTELSDKESQ
ncbi:MAG: hypothetical protein EHM48_00655 [Planctomycetaceae bacterium]|nr:MAG: hypothetical protein EHM48_00655 [Planctomycetaceae bacterium]